MPRRRGRRAQPRADTGRGLRILYWFRTPPGVRVGRAAIDEEAIRQLEQHNPDVQFDWTRILKQPAPTESPRQVERALPSSAGTRDRAPAPTRPPTVSDIVRGDSRSEAVESSEIGPAAAPGDDGDTSSVALEPAQQPILDDPEVAIDFLDAQPPETTMKESAALIRLGAEGLARLRARYAEILARISERPLTDEGREELKSRAERLNPDAWVTDEEVQQGLEQYETVFESLRSVLGHPRRRRSRRQV